MSNWLGSAWKGAAWLSNAWGSGSTAVDSLAFHALTYDPDTYEFLPFKAGIGPATQGRSSERYALNNEGLYYSVPAYEVAINGGRDVKNEATYSEDLTNAAWVKTNGTATATVFTATSGNATCLQTLTKAASDRIYSCTIGRVTGAGTIEITTDGGTTWVDITSAVAATAKRFTCNKSAEVNPQYGARVVTSGDEISLTYNQNEDATGRADTTTPSEYCATDTVGAGDPSGYKIFANANGNTVASNVVTEAVGDPLVELPWYGASPAASNLIPYSRDLTNVAWIKYNSPTVAYDEVGLSGAPNTASTVTDDSAVALEYIYNSWGGITADTTHSFVLYIKKDTDETRFPAFQSRLSGGSAKDVNCIINTATGAIAKTHTDVANASVEAELIGDWWRIIFAHTDTGTNTSLRLEFYPAIYNTWAEALAASAQVSATGSIIVGNIEAYDNRSAAEVRGLSPIFTAGAPVATTADDLHYDDANHSDTEGGYYFEYRPSAATSEISGDHQLLSLNAGVDLAYYDGTAGDFESADGTNTAAKSQALVAGTIYKVFIAFGSSALRICVDGSWGTEQSYDGAFPSGSALDLFNALTHSGEMRDLRFYNLSYAAAQTQGDALMIDYISANFDSRILAIGGDFLIGV